MGNYELEILHLSSTHAQLCLAFSLGCHALVCQSLNHVQYTTLQ